MDERTFDHVTRAVGALGSRRRLLGLGAVLPLSGLLATLPGEESAAKRKQHGRKRSHRPGKNKDNRKGQRNNGGGLGAGEDTPCLGPLTNLQNAIDQAQAGDTLTLCAGSFPNNVLYIDKTLTIVGAGSGQTVLNSSPIIESYLKVASGATVSLRGLTITRWGAEEEVPIANLGILHLADVTVTECHSPLGIIMNGGTLTIDEASRITQNFGAREAGGILNQGTITCAAAVVTDNFVGDPPAPGGDCVDTGGGSGCATCTR